MEYGKRKTFDKKSFFLLLFLIFSITASYGIARSCIDSLFLQYHSSSKLPIVWLAIVAFTAFTIIQLNKLNSQHAISKVLYYSTILSLMIYCFLLILFFFNKKIASFLLYIWKDVYIIVLAENFWSYADITISLKMARWAYGIFLAIGSVGGIISNYLISPISLRFGTVNTALLIIPLFFICAITGYILDKKYSDNIPIKTKRKKEFFETIKIITKSIYLKYILLLVIITQIIITLIDFKFNFVLQESYPILDSRTQVIAHIHLLIDTTSLIFQLLTGLIFKFLGIKILMTSIPIINLLIIFLFTAIPHFAGMIMLKITSKVLDYSIFKPLKEMLYIPLNRKEKTKGKSFIDIFAYRSSKGLSSTVLISLIAIGAMKLIIPIIIFLQFNCIILSCIVVNKYRKIKNNKKKVNSKI